MKFDSKGLRKETLPMMDKGLKRIMECSELINDVQSDTLELNIDFDCKGCCQLLDDTEKAMKKMSITIEYTVDLFEKNEKANMQIIDSIFSLDGDYFSEIFGDEDLAYGVGQRHFFYKIYGDIYEMNEFNTEIINRIAKKFNMSYEDAVQACTVLDSVGACTYAATANEILYAYRYDPVAFEKDFGYPMFVIDENNNFVVNAEMLLMDLYVFYNSEENGGFLFSKDKNGKLQVNDECVELCENTEYPVYRNVKGQAYPDAGGSGLRITIPPGGDSDNKGTISEGHAPGAKFLEAKHASKRINCEKACYGSNDIIHSSTKDELDQFDYSSRQKVAYPETKEELKKVVENNLDEDTSLFLTIDNNSDIVLTQPENHGVGTTTFDGEHAMLLVGTTDDGIIVSSWGDEYIITYDDLIENGNYSIMMCTSEDI